MTRGKLHNYQGDEEFVRAADEVLRHIAQVHGLHATVQAVSSERRTVVRVSVTAHAQEKGGTIRAVAAVSDDFPNARASTLAACVFALTVKLDHVIDAGEEALARVVSAR